MFAQCLAALCLNKCLLKARCLWMLTFQVLVHQQPLPWIWSPFLSLFFSIVRWFERNLLHQLTPGRRNFQGLPILCIFLDHHHFFISLWYYGNTWATALSHLRAARRLCLTSRLSLCISDAEIFKLNATQKWSSVHLLRKTHTYFKETRPHPLGKWSELFSFAHFGCWALVPARQTPNLILQTRP